MFYLIEVYSTEGEYLATVHAKDEATAIDLESRIMALAGVSAIHRKTLTLPRNVVPINGDSYGYGFHRRYMEALDNPSGYWATLCELEGQ